MPEFEKALQLAYTRLAGCHELLAAARCLKSIGDCIQMPHAAVIDDYSSRRPLTVEGGRTLASVFGSVSGIFDAALQRELHLVGPTAAVCRMVTKPFVWEAASAIGAYGGITVPIHLPRGRTGSVSWYSCDMRLDTCGVLAQHGDLLRLAGHRFMDLVYDVHAQTESCDGAGAQLSRRELECLSWAALGRTDADIGGVIHRSPTTARFHINNAVRKLGARNRTQAVAIAAQRGLIHEWSRG